MNQIDVSSI